jgi:hypothetical protein
MKKIILIVAGIMLLASCKKDVNQPALSLKTLAVHKDSPNGNSISGVTRPLKDSGSGTTSLIPGGCGVGTFQVSANGTGISTALGSFTQTTSFCMNSSFEPISTPTGVGIAANGDKLNYTFVGTGTDPETGFTYQNYIFSGGTGRFANATGNVTLLYSVRTQTNYAYTGTGTITY